MITWKEEKMELWKNLAKVKFSELLFYIFLVLMCGIKGFGLYDGQLIYKIFFVAGMLCVVWKMCLDTYSPKEFIAIGILGAVAVLSTLHSGEKGVILTYAVVVGMKKMSLKKCSYVCAMSYGISMFLMVTFYGIFLNKSPFFTGEKLGLTGVVRWTLGYPHPNTLHVTYLALCAFIIYTMGKKYSLKEAMILMVGNIYIFLYSMSYTGGIVAAFLILGAYYVNRKEKLSIIEYIALGLIYPASIFYALLAPYILPPGVQDFLKNNLYTIYHRLELARTHVRPVNLSLFGTRLSEVTQSEFSLDNSFLYCLVFNGVFYCIVIVIAYGMMIYKLIKEKRKIEVFITAAFLIQGVLEPFLFNTSFKNITLFFLGAVLWENRKDVSSNGKIKLFKDKEIYCVRLRQKMEKIIIRLWAINKSKILRICMSTASIAIIIAIVVLPRPSLTLLPLWEYIRQILAYVWLVFCITIVLSCLYYSSNNNKNKAEGN